jgi:hypothetical protein
MLETLGIFKTVSQTEDRFLIDTVIRDVHVLQEFGSLQEFTQLVDGWLLFLIAHSEQVVVNVQFSQRWAISDGLNDLLSWSTSQTVPVHLKRLQIAVVCQIYVECLCKLVNSGALSKVIA